MTTTIKNYWLKQKQMTEACRMDPKTFRKLGVAPIHQQGNAKYYLVADVLHAHHRYQLRQNAAMASYSDDDMMVDKEHEEALKTREERINKQLKNEVLLQQQAPISIMEEAIGSAVSSADAVLSSVVLNIKRQNPEIKASVLNLIDKEIKKAQNIMASVQPEWIEDSA